MNYVRTKLLRPETIPRLNYQALNRRAGVVFIISRQGWLVLNTLTRKSKFRNFRDSLTQIRNEYSASRLPLDFPQDSLGPIPEIELIVSSTQKDFHHLPTILKQAVDCSVNHISKITVAVPANYLDECSLLLQPLQALLNISIMSEDEILSLKIRSKLKKAFPARYGWILQQFLTVQQVLESNSAGVLQINSDTYLLREKLWLKNDGSQILMESSEFHKPYYELLHRLDSKFPIRSRSHITHHMLFQPILFREILNRLGIQTLEELVDFVCREANTQNESFACIEFELYALGLLKYFPNRTNLVKFGNRSIPSLARPENRFELIETYKDYYNSISLHSYLSS